jgi:hypothetical protein
MISQADRGPRNAVIAVSRQMLTVEPALPIFRFAVAPVTQSFGEVTCKRLHWSGVVRRGAVDTTPGFTTSHPTPRRPEHRPREYA